MVVLYASFRNESVAMTYSTAEPLLTRFATLRQPGQDTPGRYCERQRMWVVDGPLGSTPLIATASALAEVTTKTKVEVESDDTADIAALQLVTKTAAQLESDDESRSTASVLALLTKTEVSPEQDKQDVGVWGSALPELITKTSVQQEQDSRDIGAQLSEQFWPMGGLGAAPRIAGDLSIPLAARLRH